MAALLTDLRLGDIQGLLPVAVVLVDAAGKLVEADRAARRLFALDDREPYPSLHSLFTEPDTSIAKYLTLCRRNRAGIPGRFSIRAPDGQTARVLVLGARLPADQLDGVCLIFQDYAASRQSQRFTTLNQSIHRLRAEIKKRQHVEAILEAEKQTLASVIQGEPLMDALRILATAVELHSDGMLVSILLLDDDQCLRHAVAPSLPDPYVQAIDGLAIGPDVGSCGTAAFTGSTVITVDIASDPRWRPYRALAAEAGLRACWSSPILSSDGGVLGTLALYYRSPREPTAEELQMVENSAYVAGVAIERFRSQQVLTELLQKEQQQRAHAEAENRAKDEFLAMLGHELRNPLGAIANAALALDANLGVDDALDRPPRTLLKIVLNETRQLKRILDDLLDISRLSRGKLQLHPHTLSLDAFAEELIGTVRASYPDRAIGFEIGDDLGAIVADHARLRQCVQNLVHNAVKYTAPDERITVTIDTDADALHIRVADTGRGIEAGVIDAIFDPFVQCDESTARTASGLGLGLALVKRFVDMHGGDVAASSDGPGRGSTFTIRVPRGALDAASPPETAIGKQAAGARKVLIVEDNDDAREGLSRLLEAWGHEVHTAADGQEALDIIADTCPDLALVDIGLPRIDGYEVARLVRQGPQGGAITLVALTGYGQSSDRQRAIEAGFDAHIVKPADAQDLARVLGPISPP